VTYPNNIPLTKKPPIKAQIQSPKPATAPRKTFLTATPSIPSITIPVIRPKNPVKPVETDYLVPKIAQPLFIQIQLDSHPVDALINTGANLDVINSRIIKRFNFHTQNIKPLEIKSYSTEISQTVQTTTQLPTKVGECETEQWFFFVAETHHEVILGVPWLCAHRVQFD
jgi:hypothetical protein